MAWISEHSAAISALGSIAMNISTIAIIIFNMHQFKLNRSSLNIEINFRLFAQRKKLYNDLNILIGLLKDNNNFNIFTEEKDGILVSNSRYSMIKDMIEDSEYLYSRIVFVNLCVLLELFTKGISLEAQMHAIKAQDVQNWTDDTTNTLKQLAEESKALLNSIQKFDIEMLTEYLNVSKFNKDFINGVNDSMHKKFSQVLFAVKEKSKELDKQHQKGLRF